MMKVVMDPEKDDKTDGRLILGYAGVESARDFAPPIKADATARRVNWRLNQGRLGRDKCTMQTLKLRNC